MVQGQQIRKCMHRVRVLACSFDLDFGFCGCTGYVRVVWDL
jgi:hypothetical protein